MIEGTLNGLARFAEHEQRGAERKCEGASGEGRYFPVAPAHKLQSFLGQGQRGYGRGAFGRGAGYDCRGQPGGRAVDGARREGGNDRTRGNDELLRREICPQLLNRTSGALLGCLLGNAQGVGDFPERLAFKEAEQDDIPFAFSESANGFIQQRRDALPGFVGVKLKSHEFDGLLLVISTPRLRPKGMASREARRPVQPAGKDRSRPKLGCFPRENEEHRLSDFLGNVRIADNPEARGIDQVHVPLHERSKRLLGLAGRVLPQEFQVIHTGWPLLIECPLGTKKGHSSAGLCG